jgi:DNA-binding NarL/FixJ family response regulator
MSQILSPDAHAPTQREHELILLITRGLQNKEIAHAMKISENTVKAHIANILRKYKLHNRTQIAMMFAVHVELLRVSSPASAGSDIAAGNDPAEATMSPNR